MSQLACDLASSITLITPVLNPHSLAYQGTSGVKTAGKHGDVLEGTVDALKNTVTSSAEDIFQGLGFRIYLQLSGSNHLITWHSPLIKLYQKLGLESFFCTAVALPELQ